MLDAIVAYKRKEIEQRKKTGLSRTAPNREPISLKRLLLNSHTPSIIAEIKRKSPSRGWFKRGVSVPELASGYIASGASALSVLTDQEFFGGSAEDLVEAREANPARPILRKDFILDLSQLRESRLLGADVVLLIAAILTPGEVAELSRAAKNEGLEVLLEVHSQEEFETSMCDYIDLVGVNSRNLRDFSIDAALFSAMARVVPPQCCKIAESGLSDPLMIENLHREHGYRGFLIGEAFMKEPCPVTACKRLVEDIQ